MNPSQQQTTAATEAKAADLLDKIAEETARIGARYMPTLTVKQFTEREKMLAELKAMLVEGTDYGTIPGTPKPTLYQAGAQKICAFFGYSPVYSYDVAIEDWDGSEHGGEPLFYYRMVCTLMKDGKPVGSGPGSCNSWESKYRYRWVKPEDVPDRFRDEEGYILKSVPERAGSISEPQFAVTKAETTGPYGKPAEYWERFKQAIKDGTARKGSREAKGGRMMETWEIDATVYRIPNEGYPDIINTVQKIAAKRCYVGATLSATGASQYFTQDIEDMPNDAIGKADTPAPGSGSQKQASSAQPDDPKLLEYVKRIKSAKTKDDRQEIFAELVDAIKSASNDDAGRDAWQAAVKPVNGGAPLPEHVVRALYSALVTALEHKQAAEAEQGVYTEAL